MSEGIGSEENPLEQMFSSGYEQYVCQDLSGYDLKPADRVMFTTENNDTYVFEIGEEVGRDWQGSVRGSLIRVSLNQPHIKHDVAGLLVPSISTGNKPKVSIWLEAGERPADLDLTPIKENIVVAIKVW